MDDLVLERAQESHCLLSLIFSQLAVNTVGCKLFDVIPKSYSLEIF